MQPKSTLVISNFTTLIYVSEEETDQRTLGYCLEWYLKEDTSLSDTEIITLLSALNLPVEISHIIWTRKMGHRDYLEFN